MDRLNGAHHVEMEGSNPSSEWPVFGTKLPKSEIVYFTQVVLIFGVVITSVLMLTVYKEPESNQFWTALLSSAIGYILPHPSLKK